MISSRPLTAPLGDGGTPAAPEPARWPLATALTLFVVVAAVLQIQSVDFFWHLAAGRYMLAHGAPLTFDPFRFTSEGAAWVDHEWGFQLLLAVVERLGGIGALVALRALMVAALAGLLFAAARRRRAPMPVAAVLVVVVLLGARSRFFLRPELATLLGLLLLLLLLLRYRTRGGGGLVAAMVLLVVAWANCHPGVLVAPPVVAAFLFGTWWAGRQGRRAWDAPTIGLRQVVGLPLLLAAAALLNPWGYRLYRVPVEIAASLSGLAATNPDWAPLWRSPQPLLYLAASALVLLLLVVWLRRRWVDPGLGFATLALVPLVVTGVRHQGLLFVAGGLLAAEALGSLSEAGTLAPVRRGRLGAAAAAAVCLGAAAWCLLPPASGPMAPATVAPRFGIGVADERFPAGAVAELERWNGVGNLFNSAPFGGYLLWRLYPPRQIFFDTRNELDPELLRELEQARSNSAAWWRLLERYEIDGAVVRYEERLRQVVDAPTVPGGETVVSYHTTSALLFPRDDFALVYWDDVAMLFLARRPEREEGLLGREYLYLQPEDWRATLSRAEADPAFRRVALAEAQRKLQQDPGCRRAAQLEALLAGGEPAASGERPSE